MKQREVILIFGRTGEGKTTLAKSILSSYTRVVVFDTASEYYGLVIENFSDFVSYFEVDRPEFFVVCRFSTMEEYEWAARAIWTIGDLLLVMEEADNYLQSTSFNNPFHPFSVLVTRGRHKKISLLAITVRPHLISITLRSVATRAVTFCHTIPEDIAYLEDWGFDGVRIPYLKRFEHLERSEYDRTSLEENSPDYVLQ